MLRLRSSLMACAFCLGLALAAPAAANTNVLFIVDASGSMKKEVGSEQRMSVAKKVLGETLAGMPADAQLGLMVYGHRKAKDCTDIELIAPIGGEEAASIGKTVQGLKPIGETPIAESLKKAAKSFKAFKGQQNSIILVTDGVEECQGDPCAAAQELKDAGLDVAVNIVGFTLGAEEGKALQCVADITGGKYYAASDAKALTEALQNVQKQVQETIVVQTAEPPKDDGDILAAKNGGTLVYAPSNVWERLNRDHENFEGPTYTGEAVWSFRDGKPATFDRVEVLVPKAYEYNLKDFEILAGDELGGPYKSLGSFTVQNVKMMPEGWQAFKFPETKAKFVKIVFKSDQGGGHIGGNALRLIGKIDEAAPAAEAPVASDGIDLLAESHGGTLVYAPSNIWERLNKDHENFKGPTYTGESLWSFKDGKAATFDRIQMLVQKQYEYNVKDFEVLASDEPTGPFKSLGSFTAQNAKVLPDGWQTFNFPQTTARYVKIVFKSDQGGGHIGGNPLRLIGKIDEASTPAEKPAEIEGTNILAQAAGGTLLMGPDDNWKHLNDGGAGDYAFSAGTEGVWSFAGEKPATFEAVEVLVPQSHSYCLKEFEVLVGDEGPTGTFKSLGVFTVQNIKVMPEGYQRFTFPKVQAKYVKFVLKSSYGSYIRADEFRVIGKVGE